MYKGDCYCDLTFHTSGVRKEKQHLIHVIYFLIIALFAKLCRNKIIDPDDLWRGKKREGPLGASFTSFSHSSTCFEWLRPALCCTIHTHRDVKMKMKINRFKEQDVEQAL